MGNKVTKIFTANSSWTAPAGVTSVSLLGITNPFTFPLKNNSASGSGLGAGFFIDTGGNLYGYGGNNNGQLGVGDVTPRSSPVAVLGGLTFKKVLIDCTGFDGTTFGLTTSGILYAWGNNANGQLGLGDVTPRSSPVAVLGGLRFQDFTVFNSEVLAITTGGVAYGWGFNANGQLGVGDVTPRSSPVAVLGGLTFRKILNDSTYALGLTTTGVVYFWGSNSDGTGCGDVTPRSSPVAVLGGLTARDIAMTGGGSSYILNTAGALYAFGANPNGELALGDVTSRSSPVAVLGGLTFSSVITTLRSIIGLTSTGVAYAWGRNASGQLGVGDVTPRSSPVAVLGGLTFGSILGGASLISFMGLTTGGVAYGWGNNANGNLGVGDALSKSSPVAVLGGLTFGNLAGSSATRYFIYGTTPGGTVYAWGDNTNGNLGVGDVTPRSSPVAVLGGLLGSVNPVTHATTVVVVPGTTYTITMIPFVATFGNTAVGQGPLSSLVLEYET